MEEEGPHPPEVVEDRVHGPAKAFEPGPSQMNRFQPSRCFRICLLPVAMLGLSCDRQAEQSVAVSGMGKPETALRGLLMINP